MSVDTIEIESSDPLEAKYEALGKIIQINKEGLARLEKEEPAKKARKKE
jgi:hypothetical protein